MGYYRQNIKILCLMVSDKKIFKVLFRKSNSSSLTLDLHIEEDHIRIIIAKFGHLQAVIKEM